MANLDFVEKIGAAAESITTPEQMLGKGLVMPFAGANSGARKNLHDKHRDHILPLMRGEKATIETGYEIRFGDYSSSIIEADSDYKIIAKISKFSFAPNHHYWLILEDMYSKRLDVVERISYFPISQNYGYLNNNEYLDSKAVGQEIHKGDIVAKSLAFDRFNNRTDGVNAYVAYMASDDNMEDSMIMSTRLQAKLDSPLIKPIPKMINDNDIPLNIYGDDKNYKIIPDIGEDVKNGILIATRKEKKIEALYSQSVDMLRKITLSDDVIQVHGKIIDLDIYCSNPDILDSHYYGQLKMYNNEFHRRCKEFIQLILPYKAQGYELSYELSKLFADAKRVCNGDKFSDKRPFSNIMLVITVLETLKMNVGDKAANRHGGKGVVSKMLPLERMPRFKNDDGEWEYVDLILNSSTMVNRENAGQIFELSLTHIERWIIKKIKNDLSITLEDAYKMTHKFISYCSPQQAYELAETIKNMSAEELSFYMDSIIKERKIDLSMRPISDAMDIDKLNEIYKAFPFVEQDEIEVPIESSTGEIRYIPARRRIVIGEQHILRLKQYSEEKFIATSLSSTNIRNENTKSRAKKDYRELFSNTPIRFGSMEINQMLHLGADVVISALMIHSVSPQGRRLVEQMYTDDPFKINVRLDSDSKNRSAEEANTYLKAIGRKLNFERRFKQIQKILSVPIEFDNDPVQVPIRMVPEDLKEGFDYEKDYEERQKLYAKMKKTKAQSPVYFDGRNRLADYNK